MKIGLVVLSLNENLFEADKRKIIGLHSGGSSIFSRGRDFHNIFIKILSTVASAHQISSAPRTL